MADSRLNKMVSNNHGAALVVTLAIVAILITTALQLARFTGDSVRVTIAEKNRFQAEQLALSGIHLALLILSEDAEKNAIDSDQEAWADPEKLSQAVSEMGLDKDTLTLAITDELSKIQVNALLSEFPGNQINPDQRKIWETFLRNKFNSDKTEDQPDPEKIINCVKDWLDDLDDDTISGISGAESDFYQALNPPYACANGPFNHISEILSVNGMATALKFNDTAATDSDTGTPVKTPSINDLFTVYGLDSKKTGRNGYKFPGKVNINTADAQIISALLPHGMDTFAQDLVEYRKAKDEEGKVFINSLDKRWYLKVIELSEKEQKRFDRIIRYSSDTFKVECTAKKDDIMVKRVAFIKREKQKLSGKWKCRILQLERE